MTQRPIKFRAWDTVNKRWFYAPSPVDSRLGDFLMTADGRVYIAGVYQDLVLCQFTGLKDKHDVEIFESDVVRRNNGDFYEIGSVEYRDCSFTLKRIGRKNWV